PLLTLESAGLINLTNVSDVSDAYSFIFNGNSQALDHILVSPSLFPAEFDAVHAAIDAAEDIESVTSDHDPIIVKLDLSDD
ncbi:MAG: endonuclease, partial [Pseudomonadota bacterium]